MTKRIFQAICFVALAVFFASSALILGVLYPYFSNVQQTQLRAQTMLAAQGMAREGAAYFDGLTLQNCRITWIAADGTVLYDSQSDSARMENHLAREEVAQAIKEGSGESRRYSATLMDRYLYCAQRLPDGTVLRLSVAQGSVLMLLLGMAQPFCIILAVAITLSICLAIHIAKKIVAPLNELDLDHPLSGQGYDELTPLLRRIDSQQRQLRQGEQQRREFTANVSHELKSPLHVISGYAELIKNDLVQPQDLIPFAQRIYEEAQRMVHLVEDIISLSHLDEGAQDMERETVDLYELARTVVQALEVKAEAAHVTLKLTGEAAPLYGIPTLLHSILYNLCDNAIKYNHKGGSVTVEVKDIGDFATVSVSDTGIGIPAEHQSRIFERFYRVDKSHSKEIGGTGLGLSIVKHAAKLHHAEIALHSVVDQGTEITIRFPKG